MSNRWIRFLLAVLAILAASAAAYRVVEDERRVAQDVRSTRDAEFKAGTALATVEDLKSSLHAYVAPGQGLPFWAARAGQQLDTLRSSLLEIDNVVTAAGGTLGESLDVLDRLAAAEGRAQEHVRAGQPLLAGDVIFNDARNLLDGLRLQIARARDQISSAASARQGQVRREEMTLIAAAIGVLALVMLLLVPPGRPAAQPASTDPAGRTVTAAPLASAASASARSNVPASYAETSPKRSEIQRREGGPVGPGATAVPGAPRAPRAPGAPAAPAAPAAPGTPAAPAASGTPAAPRLTDLASICADIAAVGESTQLEPILQRIMELLKARGVIVWLRSPDRVELHAAAAVGYDDRIVARLGPIHRETGNLTAHAFRDNMSRTSAAAGTTAAALAVPLPSPDGPAGVFSAELTAGTGVDEGKLAAARVIAAQLGALLGSIPDASAAAPAAPAARSSS